MRLRQPLYTTHLLIFGVLAAGSWAGVVYVPWLALRIVLILLGVSFTLVFLAYAGAGPGMYLKQTSGALRPVAWAIHWPYFAIKRALYTLFRWTSSEEPYHEILPGLYLGRRLTRREAARLEGVAAVVDLAGEFHESAAMREGREYLNVPVLDYTAATVAQLRMATDWITEQIRKGPVYIHCILGHGRGGLMTCAYLLAAGEAKTPKEAYDTVRALRGGVNLGRHQFRALEDFAETLPAAERDAPEVEAAEEARADPER